LTVPADLTVIVSDAYYHATTGPHRPGDYHRIRLGRGPSTAWLYTPGGARPRTTAVTRPGLLSAGALELSPSGPDALEPDALEQGVSVPDIPGPDVSGLGEAGWELIGRAERGLREGGYRAAIVDLEAALRLPYGEGGAAEEALLLLGDCHRHLGDLEAAAQTWLFLLARHPLSVRACRRLGRLESRRGRTDLAWGYLTEALRILRAHPERTPAPGRDVCALLLDLSCVLTTLGDHAAADDHLNEAAEADPPSPLPLLSLACRAARRGDVQAARRLLGTALVRVPPGDRADFLHEHFQGAASWEGGDVIIKVLLENGLDPAAPRRTTDPPHPLRRDPR
jgi:tetratricopeptide (TPR) repeat protein